MTRFTLYLQNLREFNMVTKGLKNKVSLNSSMHVYIIYTYWIDAQLQNTYNLSLKFWINKKHVKTETSSIISNNTNLSKSSFHVVIILCFNILASYLCITQRTLIDLF